MARSPDARRYAVPSSRADADRGGPAASSANVGKVALERVQRLFEGEPRDRGEDQRPGARDQKAPHPLLRDIDGNEGLRLDDNREDDGVVKIDTVADAAEGSHRRAFEEAAQGTCDAARATADEHRQRHQRKDLKPNPCQPFEEWRLRHGA